MKSLILLLKIILIIYLIDSSTLVESICSFFNAKKESFFPLANDGHVSINDSIGNTISDKKDYFTEKNCCLVSKVFNKDKDKFEYIFEKRNNCKITDATNNNMQHLFIDGIDGWDNKNCKTPSITDDNPIGSCRIYNFECRDVLTRNKCLKYGMEWSDRTCQTPYQKPFKISDRKISYGTKTWSV